MQYKYVDTAEIMISIRISTGQLKQLIEWLADHRLSIEEGTLEKMIIADRIKEMQDIYETAMTGIAKYAEGQKTNV